MTSLTVLHTKALMYLLRDTSDQLVQSRSKSFRMGDSFDFLYPRTSSTVGVSPLRGRLVTDRVRKFLA
jgi:hypothetical protein